MKIWLEVPRAWLGALFGLAFAISGCAGSNADERQLVVVQDGRLPKSSYRDFCDSPNCPTGGAPVFVRRPLSLRQTDDEECRVTETKTIDVAGWVGGLAFGDGPIFVLPLADGAGRGTIEYVAADNLRDPVWGGVAVKILSEPRYDGLVLLRGSDLVTGRAIGFSRMGGEPFADMNLAPGDPANAFAGWRQWPEEIRFAAPGCYGIQIDGMGFTDVIVFRAEPAT